MSSLAAIEEHATPEETKQAERRARVAQLILQGWTVKAEIAREVGCHPMTVTRDIDAIKAEFSEFMEAASKVLDSEMAKTYLRLEDSTRMAYEVFFHAKTDEGRFKDPELALKAIDRILKVEEARRKLMGMDKPSKIAHTDPTGEQEYRGIPPELKRQLLINSRQQKQLDEAQTVTVEAEDQ